MSQDHSFRVIAYAYKEMSYQEYAQLAQEYNNFQSEEDRGALESSLTFGGAFGLKDELRKNVPPSILFANKGCITVRMVSGDSRATAVAVAIAAGIISKEQALEKNVVMSGEEFKNVVGGVKKGLPNEKGEEEYMVANMDSFRQIAAKLRVLARATPYEKLALVAGLKQMNKTVAVTGDSSNDAMALQVADIGLCMGSGCNTAKDASDMILLDDNFGSTMSATMWGRNIYQNIRKFLQF